MEEERSLIGVREEPPNLRIVRPTERAGHAHGATILQTKAFSRTDEILPLFDPGMSRSQRRTFAGSGTSLVFGIVPALTADSSHAIVKRAGGIPPCPHMGMVPS